MLRAPNRVPGRDEKPAGTELLGVFGFRLAVALLPGWLGTRFEAEMHETFRERQSDALAHGGMAQWLRTTIREIGGVIRLAMRSRLKGRKVL